MRSLTLVAVALIGISQSAATLAEAPLAEAPAAGESPLVGEWPTSQPRLTLELEDGTVGSAIEEIAEKAGWGLVISAPEHLLDREVTLRLRDRPANEVLRPVLEAGALKAKLSGGILTVTPASPRAARTERGTVRVQVNGDHHELEIDEDDRVVVGSKVLVASGETVENAVAVGGSLTVDGQVEGDAVAVGGSLAVNGEVEGDAVAMGGSVTLGPQAKVEGQAVAIGGEVQLAPGATLEGDRVSVGGSLGKLLLGLTAGTAALFAVPAFLFTVLGTLLRALVLVILGLLLVAMMPERLERIGRFFDERPAPSVLAGIGLMLGLIPLTILLVITIIGIVPLVLVVLPCLVAVLVIGLASLALWIGNRLPIGGARKPPLLALLLGVLIITAVDYVPFLGTTMVVLAAFVAAGATLLSRLGAGPTRSSPNVAPSA